MNDKKTCFIISPIGESGSSIRLRADAVLKHIIKPALQDFGYEAERADHITDPGLITNQVVQRIIDAPLVIADLTGSNPNVFYEIAIRHMIRKPIIQLVRDNERIPFDLQAMRVIKIDENTIGGAAEACDAIKSQIQSLIEMESDEIESPISAAVDLHELNSSDNLELRSLGEIRSSMSELRGNVSNIAELLNKMKSFRISDSTTEITINNSKWSKDELAGVILSHEKLRAAVLTATADNVIDELEMIYLKRKANRVESFSRRLDKRDKRNLLDAYINAASANSIFQDEQYDLIRSEGFGDNQSHITVDELNEMIVDQCILHRSTTPSQISESIDKKYSEDEKHRLFVHKDRS